MGEKWLRLEKNVNWIITNTWHGETCDAAEAGLRGKFRAWKVYIEKKEGKNQLPKVLSQGTRKLSTNKIETKRKGEDDKDNKSIKHRKNFKWWNWILWKC